MPKYIDADALLAEAKKLSGPMTGDGWSNWGVYALIERQPAADVEPITHGHWIDYTYKGQMAQKCSVCGSNPGVIYSYPCCPYCQAKMDE